MDLTPWQQLLQDLQVVEVEDGLTDHPTTQQEEPVVGDHRAIGDYHQDYHQDYRQEDLQEDPQVEGRLMGRQDYQEDHQMDLLMGHQTVHQMDLQTVPAVDHRVHPSGHQMVVVVDHQGDHRVVTAVGLTPLMVEVIMTDLPVLWKQWRGALNNKQK